MFEILSLILLVVDLVSFSNFFLYHLFMTLNLYIFYDKHCLNMCDLVMFFYLSFLFLFWLFVLYHKIVLVSKANFCTNHFFEELLNFEQFYQSIFFHFAKYCFLFIFPIFWFQFWCYPFLQIIWVIHC